jgi:hypothetical protein
MMPGQKEMELRLLFARWLNGTADEEAIHKLAGYAGDPEMTEIWQLLLAGIPAKPLENGADTAVLDRVYQHLVATQPELKAHRTVQDLYVRIRYAAAILIILLAGGLGYFLFNNPGKQHNKRTANISQANDTVPLNTGKAVLTLGNGREIVLDSTGKGLLAQQAGAMIYQPGNGQIIYRKSDSLLAAKQPPEYHTLRTPKGAAYEIVLPDGTAVWLNAASSITFPAVFTGTVRNVSVTGEVYFEVAKNAAMPFNVKVDDARIEVLGTHFNISAYKDDPVVKTTLLEGVVRLVTGQASRLLKPGQQAQFTNGGGTIKLIADADTEEAVAWKNGSFNFKNQDIGIVMNQIGRWYNMEIVYEGKKPEGLILGMMSRRTDLATVLASLELTSGIHFEIKRSTVPGEAGKIIVKQ